MSEELMTVVLGNGDKIISDISNQEEGWAGFCIANGECAVGEDYKTDAETDIEMGAFFRIITDNPKSLDVIIDKCEKAKKFLMYKQLMADNQP